MNDALSDLHQRFDSSSDAQKDNTLALQLFSDADDNEIDQHSAGSSNTNLSLNDSMADTQNCETTKSDPTTIMPDTVTPTNPATPPTTAESPSTSVIINAVTPNSDHESDNETVIYASDPGSPLQEAPGQEANQNSPSETNQDDNPSETELEEISLNKCNKKIYFRNKKTPNPVAYLPTTTDSTINTDIDMVDVTMGTDTNMELHQLSDNFAENLTITDLEELMEESEPPDQTILPTRPQSPRGSFTYRLKGIRRKPSVPVSAGENKYKCPACPRTWNTRGEMCEHYRNSHPPLPCPDCSMTFTSPLTLARHSYKHKERPIECTVCGEKFAFNSELTQHIPVHKKPGSGGFFCMANKCGKSFIRKGDLSAHVRSHNGPLLECEIDPNCPYSTRNPRLYKAHLNTHTRRKKYSCKRCGEEFDYTQQVKRHVEKNHV